MQSITSWSLILLLIFNIPSYRAALTLPSHGPCTCIRTRRGISDIIFSIRSIPRVSTWYPARCAVGNPISSSPAPADDGSRSESCSKLDYTFSSTFGVSGSACVLTSTSCSTSEDCSISEPVRFGLWSGRGYVTVSPRNLNLMDRLRARQVLLRPAHTLLSNCATSSPNSGESQLSRATSEHGF